MKTKTSKIAVIVVVVLLIVVVAAVAVSVSQRNNSIEEEIAGLKETHGTISDGIRTFEVFFVNDYEIHLYPEATMTADEALETYADAYELCCEAANERGIEASVDNTEFQALAKTYAAQNESGSEELINECKAFAVFMDYYENIAINDTILRGAITDDKDIDIFELMPE